MPSQYKMIVSHSPPVFSHSPPAGFLTDYTTNTKHYDSMRNLYRQNHFQQFQQQQQQQQQQLQQQQYQQKLNALQNQLEKPLKTIRITMPTSPKRSCLVVKPINSLITLSSVTPTMTNGNTNNNNNNNNSTDVVDSSTPPSPSSNIDSKSQTSLSISTAPTEQKTKTKKRVVFADDKGKSLTEVRIMKEPSNVPPLWSLEFLAHVTQGMVSPVPIEEWTVSFQQPASHYLDFRRKLDSQNVSLENVIVKESESIVVGTVKVRNLSFKKEVFVRTTYDDWKTQEDTFCTYSTIGGSSGAYVIYDTFSFKLTLPPAHRKIEFCVCFQSDGTEYWDNNNNENYKIFKRNNRLENSAETTEADPSATINNNNSSSTTELQSTNNKIGRVDYGRKENAPIPSTPIGIPNSKYANLNEAKISSWSEFASWQHLETSSPYW